MSKVAIFTSSSYTPDNLLLPGEEPVSRQITLVSGQTCVRGAMLGKITSGGKYTLSLSASSDGSQTPDCVLAEDCDASGGDKVTNAYFVGRLNTGGLTIGTAHTAASIQEGLRAKGLHLISPLTTY